MPLPGPEERRRIRLAAGFSQQDVAEAIGTSRTAIARFEKRAGYIDGMRLPGREARGTRRRLRGCWGRSAEFATAFLVGAWTECPRDNQKMALIPLVPVVAG